MYVLRAEFHSLRGLLTVVANLFLMAEPYVAEYRLGSASACLEKSPAGDERSVSKWMTLRRLSL